MAQVNALHFELGHLLSNTGGAGIALRCVRIGIRVTVSALTPHAS